jgi:hypothetical protein
VLDGLEARVNANKAAQCRWRRSMAARPLAHFKTGAFNHSTG